MHYDVIIIGSGLAGLSAGAKLARAGRKVLLIEQHYLLGGCATHFKRKGYRFEVSLHELNGLDKNEHLYKMYKDLNAFENLTFLKIPEFYRWIGPNMDIVIPDNVDQAMNLFINTFPHEEKGIRKYFNDIFKIRNALFKMPENNVSNKLLTPVFPLLFPRVVFNLKKSVGEFLDTMIKDDNLKLVLLGNLLYYHDDPYSMSLLYFSVAQSSYFSGAHYIQGGSQQLSDYLASLITSNHGEILSRYLVTKIITENGKAIGVEYKANKKSAIKTDKAFAKHIIANAAVPLVANELLDKENAKKIKDKIENLRLSPSLLTVYIGFKTTLKKYGVKHYTTVICDKSCTSPKNIYNNFTDDFSRRNFLFVDYGQVDSKLAPEGKSVGSICTSDYLADWEHLSDEDYKSRKRQVAEILIKRLNDVYPGIKDAVDYYEVGTAKTIKRYTLNPGGCVYGFAQCPSQAGNNRFPQESPLKNLYYASAWTEPGGGFGAALGSGYQVAHKIMKSERKYYLE